MLMALYAAVSCDEQYDYYKVGKNNPTVRTLDVSEEQVGETWVTLIGSVKWEQSTSDHSFDCRFAISESPDFPAGESDTLYSSWNSISQEDTTTHYYEVSADYDFKPGTTYYYAFSITDDIVEVSGETKSFTTLGQAQDDPDNPTDAPRLVIEPEYDADAIGGDQSVPFIIENYDTRLYGELIDEIFLVERIEGGDDWITDLGYGGVEYGEDGCSGYVHFIVAPNEAGYDRSCIMSVRLSIEGVVEQEEFIYISQPSMSVEEPNLIMREGTEFSVDAEGGDYDTFIPFIIENYGYEYFESHGEPALWIENGADWLSNVEYAYLEYESGGDCIGYINLTADANTSGSDRTGTFTFGFEDQSYDISISQPQLDTDLGNATGQFNGHDYVDLGLSVMWATCNVGASSPSEYGDYYIWGGIEPKSESSSGYAEGADMVDISGNPQYDAATANWGDGWRMPTLKEAEELEECAWEWTTREGVNGYNVTGPNGNSIFFPAVGFSRGTSLDVLYIGEYGSYWLSEGSALASYAMTISSDSYLIGGAVYSSDNGYSIRPVLDK